MLEGVADEATPYSLQWKTRECYAGSSGGAAAESRQQPQQRGAGSRGKQTAAAAAAAGSRQQQRREESVHPCKFAISAHSSSCSGQQEQCAPHTHSTWAKYL
jgi:hypothetical protein